MNHSSSPTLERREIWHFHMFWGLGGAFGRVGDVLAMFRCCHTVAEDGATPQACGIPACDR